MKNRWPHAEARAVAEALRARLAPHCARLAIVGSLRREKPEVGDIELLYVPRFEERMGDGLPGFAEPVKWNAAEEEIGQWVAEGTLSLRPNKNGGTTWGAQNKLALHRDGLPVDLFATTEEHWFMALVIRTGPKESNLALIAAARRHGLQLHAYGVYEEISTGGRIVPHCEAEVFTLAGLPCRKPPER